MDETNKKIYEYLERLSRVVRSLEQKIAWRDGLSVLQLQILMALRHKRYSIEQLAKELLVTTSSISDSVKKLKEKNLVKIETTFQDRRFKVVELSELGELKAKEIYNKLTFPERAPRQGEQILESLHDLVAHVFFEGILQSAPICKTCRYFEHSKKGYFCHLLSKNLKAKSLKSYCADHEAVVRSK